MATVTEHVATTSAPEQRFLIRAVDWDWYEKLLELVGDRGAIRITYDRGNLELMSPALKHEDYKTLFGRFIETVTEELELPCRGAGSTTWKKRIEDRGLEADESFYLANTHRMAGKREKVDLNVDPPPDLAIEIEISRSALDRMAIYAALGVPEVWRFDGETLRVEELHDGAYIEADHSSAFPFLHPHEIAHWITAAESAVDHSPWGRQLRRWVRDELAPRVQAR